MKKLFCILMMIGIVFAFAGCGASKTLHCDNCKTEVEVSAKSNMTEEWLIYCEKCNEELFGDDPILGAE